MALALIGRTVVTDSRIVELLVEIRDFQAVQCRLIQEIKEHNLAASERSENYVSESRSQIAKSTQENEKLAKTLRRWDIALNIAIFVAVVVAIYWVATG